MPNLPDVLTAPAAQALAVTVAIDGVYRRRCPDTLAALAAAAQQAESSWQSYVHHRGRADNWRDICRVRDGFRHLADAAAEGQSTPTLAAAYDATYDAAEAAIREHSRGASNAERRDFYRERVASTVKAYADPLAAWRAHWRRIGNLEFEAYQADIAKWHDAPYDAHDAVADSHALCALGCCRDYPAWAAGWRDALADAHALPLGSRLAGGVNATAASLNDVFTYCRPTEDAALMALAAWFGDAHDVAARMIEGHALDGLAGYPENADGLPAPYRPPAPDPAAILTGQVF